MTNIAPARPIDQTELFNNAELVASALALEESNVNQSRNQYLLEIAKGEQVQKFRDDCTEQYGEKEGLKKYRKWLKKDGANSAKARGMNRSLNMYNFHKQLSKELQEVFVSLAHSWSAHTLTTLGKSNPKQADALAYLITERFTKKESTELPERVLKELLDSIENYIKNDRSVREEDWLRVQGFYRLQDTELGELKEEAKKYKELDPDTGDRVLTTQSLKDFLQLEGYETKDIFAPLPKPNIRKLYEKLKLEKEESDRKHAQEKAEAERKHAQELAEISTELEQTKQKLEEAYQKPAAESSNELTFDLLNLSNALDTELVNIGGDERYQAIFNTSLSPTSYNTNPLSSSFASVVESATKKTNNGGRLQSFDSQVLANNSAQKVGIGNRQKPQGFGR